MAYNSTIPQPGDKLSQSQPQILENFAQINTFVLKDHIGFTGTAAQGKHAIIHFEATTPLPPIAPVPLDPFAANEDGFFSYLDANAANFPYTGKTEVFVRKQNLAAAVNIPMTASVLGVAAPANNLDGWTYLPSGLLIKWFFFLANAGSSTITVPSAPGGQPVMGPIYTNIFSVQVTVHKQGNLGANNNFILNVGNFLANTFDVYSGQHTNTADVPGEGYAFVIGI